jgi:hypothetical protein
MKAIFTTALAAVAILGADPNPARAVPLDVSIICGQFFTAQAQQLAKMPTGYAQYQWLSTGRTPTRVTVDLLVYFPSAIVRYTGFACTIQPNGTLAPANPGTQTPVR